MDCLCMQRLPSRIAKLRAGGLAALRELRQADDEAAEAEADTKEDLKVKLIVACPSAHLWTCSPHSSSVSSLNDEDAEAKWPSSSGARHAGTCS